MKRLSAIFVLLLSGCAALAPTPREKIGVLAHTDITWPNSTGALRKALVYYKNEQVKEVVILGDPTKDGYANQREVFESTWKAAFRGVTAPKLTIAESGTHEIGGIRFTNERRYPLVDFLCVQPLTGRKIIAGSMRGFEVSGIFLKQSPQTEGKMKASAQGLLVEVASAGLTVRRLDFNGKTVGELGSPWTVDAAGLIHAEGAVPPEFWSDTKLSVIRGYDKVGNVIYTVKWPPVLARYTGERAFSYNVMLGKKVLHRVQSPAFYLPESEDTAAIGCVIAEEELKGAAPRFGIVPVSSMGLTGKTIWSE